MKRVTSADTNDVEDPEAGEGSGSGSQTPGGTTGGNNSGSQTPGGNGGGDGGGGNTPGDDAE